MSVTVPSASDDDSPNRRFSSILARTLSIAVRTTESFFVVATASIVTATVVAAVATNNVLFVLLVLMSELPKLLFMLST